MVGVRALRALRVLEALAAKMLLYIVVALNVVSQGRQPLPVVLVETVVALVLPAGPVYQVVEEGALVYVTTAETPT
jgi:hypothetical protein